MHTLIEVCHNHFTRNISKTYWYPLRNYKRDQACKNKTCGHTDFDYFFKYS